MGYGLLATWLALLALSSPSLAFEVEAGACQRILSGQARVRIHYTSGLMAEVDPPNPANITSQIDVFPNGTRVQQLWIGGGGLLPLESPTGRFTYADLEATRLRLEPGERRELGFAYTSSKGGKASGTITVSVEEVNRAAFGECQATFVTVSTFTTFSHGPTSTSRIFRLYVKGLGFFIASTVDTVRNGKPELVTFRATRVELIR